MFINPFIYFAHLLTNQFIAQQVKFHSDENFYQESTKKLFIKFSHLFINLFGPNSTKARFLVKQNLMKRIQSFRLNNSSNSAASRRT
jgi:hypothetical protein